MGAIDYLRNYYENYDEDGRLLSRHGYTEYYTTMHYIQKYLRPGMRVLEIGAGTGRYSHALARLGYEVQAVELLEHNIEIFKRNTQDGENIRIMQGNALELGALEDNSYDMTLLLGPMYHLFTRDEQTQALSEAIRVTRPGGLIYAAYCMADASILSHGFIKGRIHDIIQQCMLDPETFDTFSHPWDLFELYRTEDIAALRAQFDVESLHLVASDGYANHMRQTLAEMDEEAYRLYLKYHLATCERLDLLGISHHTLDIFRKGAEEKC